MRGGMFGCHWNEAVVMDGDRAQIVRLPDGRYLWVGDPQASVCIAEEELMTAAGTGMLAELPWDMEYLRRDLVRGYCIFRRRNAA